MYKERYKGLELIYRLNLCTLYIYMVRGQKVTQNTFDKMWRRLPDALVDFWRISWKYNIDLPVNQT